MIEQILRLEAWRDNSTQPVYEVPQGEGDSRSFLFILTSNGAPVDLTGANVSVYMTKADKNPIHNACEIVDAINGRARYVLTTQTCIYPGPVTGCIVEVVWPGPKVAKFDRWSFEITSNPDYSTVEESTSEFGALETALGNVGAMNAHMANTNNPHNVTAEQVGAIPTSAAGDTIAQLEDGKVKQNIDSEKVLIGAPTGHDTWTNVKLWLQGLLDKFSNYAPIVSGKVPATYFPAQNKITLTAQAPYANYGYIVAYKDVLGNVCLRGNISRSSGTGTLIFTMPTGWRPAYSITKRGFDWSNWSSEAGLIVLDTDGTVKIANSSFTLASVRIDFEFNYVVEG